MKKEPDDCIDFLVNETFTHYSSNDKDNRSNLQKVETTPIQFLSGFDFKQSDISDDQYADIIQILSKGQDAYSHHKYDIGKIKHKLHYHSKRTQSSKNNDLVKFYSIYRLNE